VVAERRHGVVQVRTVVLIALLAVVRKLMIIDLSSTDPQQLLALAAAIVALGSVHWLVRTDATTPRQSKTLHPRHRRFCYDHPQAREGAALTRYFGYRARVISLDLKELFRVGRRALVIGVTVLSFSVIAGQTIAASVSPHPIGRVVEESLLTFGWVANWRPIEIFLYDWWPIVRRRNLYLRLAAAQVKLRPYGNDRGGKSSGE
jgi:hypothetical protein